MTFFINPYKQIKELKAQLATVEEQLKAEKAKNAKWFEVIQGYSTNDAILINKSLWGTKFRVAEVGDE